MERFQELVIYLAALLTGTFGVLAQEISAIAVAPPTPRAHAEILFVGDMMFDRSVREVMASKGPDYILSCIAPHLADVDLVVGNLEGPITTNVSRSVGSKVGSPDNFVFTFPEYVAQLLFRHNIRAVSLGNNHIDNFGQDGVESTTRFLAEANVGYFGEPGGRSVFETELGGVMVSFIGYNQFDARWGASTTLMQIADARTKRRIPVVFAHWGDEYVEANDLQKKLARRFIDGGAEIVIGAHPHVIQEHESYRGKHIYYSLGNFVFDQYWNSGVSTGLMVRATFDKNGVTETEESRVTLSRDRRTCAMEAQ